MEYVHNNVRLGQTVKGLDTRGVVRTVDGYQLTVDLQNGGRTHVRCDRVEMI